MKFLENYAARIARGQNIAEKPARELFHNTTLYLIPMVNPDGVDLVTGLLNGGKWYDGALRCAGRYPEIPFPEGWKANVQGVDLNLQYPAGWQEARRIKQEKGFAVPAPRDFVGVAPLTAPESRAVHDFTTSHNFSMTLSYHTQGAVIYWKYKEFLPEGSWALASEFSALSGYTAEETPTESGNAGYKDWFIQTYNRPGFTVEAGEGISPLPLSQFPRIYRDNEGILTAALYTGGMSRYDASPE